MTSRDHLAELGALALGSRLKRLSDLLFQQVEELYREQGIAFHSRYFPIIAALDRLGPCGVVNLARAVGVTHAAISQLLGKMERETLIVVTQDTADARAKRIELSAKSLSLLERLRPTWQTLRVTLEAELAAVDSGFLDTLAKLERRLLDAPLAERVLRGARPAEGQVEIFEWNERYAGAFYDLNMEWIAGLFEPESLDHEMLSAPTKHFIDVGGMIFFARAGGAVVGTCAVRPTGGGTYELSKFAVSPLARRQGIGTALLKAAIAWVRDRGGTAITLETSSKLTQAASLYRRFGFVDDPEALRHTPYARADVAMRLALES